MIKKLWLKTVKTPIGAMVSAEDSSHIYFLAFADQKDITLYLQKLSASFDGQMIESDTPSLITQEMDDYFSGHLTSFASPHHFVGTDFQIKAWKALTGIPYGTTCSYKQQSVMMQHPSAVRAIANANRANPLAIIVPCHRVIRSSGNLCGYNGGIERKRWLIEHEQKA